MSNVLIIDFGTGFNKVTAYVDSEFRENKIFTNRIYHIHREKIEESLKRLNDGSSKAFLTKIQSGYYTLKTIRRKKYGGVAEEVPVQTGGFSLDDDKLRTAYTNIFEQMEDEYDIEILKSPREWYVMTAVALPETPEAQEKLRVKHEEILKSFNFAGVYARNQVMMAIMGSYDTLVQMMPDYGEGEDDENIIVQSFDGGAGDSKTVSVSGVPMPTTVQREPIGGGDVLNYAQRVMEDEMGITLYSTDELQDWLINWGDCFGNAPERKVIYRGQEIEISRLLNIPTMLFEPARFKITHDKRSVVRVLVDSLNEARKKGKSMLVGDLLNCVYVTGGSSLFGGFIDRLKLELEKAFSEFKNKINVIRAEDPQWVTLQGMINVLKTVEESGEKLDWVN